MMEAQSSISSTALLKQRMQAFCETDCILLEEKSKHPFTSKPLVYNGDLPKWYTGEIVTQSLRE